MPAPNTPTNFLVQSGNGNSFLSWDQMAGATTYLVQRSQDNVSFSNLATITAATQYTFIVSPLSMPVTQGSTYTNNSQTFTIISNYNAQATIIVASGTGAPSSSGSLVASGTNLGPTPIAFSSTTNASYLNNYYLDTTGITGIQYFYQIAAQSGGGTSAYSGSVVSIAVPIGQECLGSLREQAQSRGDFINDTFVTNQEWNRWISQSYKELYDLLIQKYGNDYYYKTPYAWTTSGSLQLYQLPNDFYKALLVEVALNPADPNSWITLRKYMRVQQNLYNYPNVYTFYGITNLRYRLTGNFLQIVPLSQAGQTVRIWYAPRPSQLLADTDIVDGVSGWEEYIIIDAAIKAKAKREDDTADLRADKAAIKQRIEEAAENRDEGDPEVVSDSRTRNFSWTDTGFGGEGNGW